jgi:L-lysine 2,3-aminomutase
MTKFKANTRKDLPQIAEKLRLNRDQLTDMQAVSAVLPFRVNDYVIERLIGPESVPNDPIFQLTFPQRGMLDEEDFRRMRDLVAKGAPEAEIKLAADEIRGRLNPHPAGQMELNVPRLDGEVVAGIQHKYQETVLFFPSQGQTCHAYCSYCFRWAQFIGDADLKFASKEVDHLVNYVKDNPQLSSVLITGGDPMVMKTPVLRRYIEPLLRAKLPNLQKHPHRHQGAGVLAVPLHRGRGRRRFPAADRGGEGGRQALRADGALEPLAGTGAKDGPARG